MKSDLYPAILAKLDPAEVNRLLDDLPEHEQREIKAAIKDYLPDCDLAAMVAGAQSDRFTLHTAAEALQPQPPIDWIIEPLYSAGSVGVMFGEPGSKKTYSAMAQAVCVACGLDWLTFKTKQSPVLIVDEESGKRRMARRLGDVMRGYQADDTTPISYTTLEAFDFRSPDDLNTLDVLMHQTAARFVIIDALADVVPGADENTVKDIQPVFVNLRRLADLHQAAIILIHHAGKNGGYRGTSAIKGAVDLLIKVESQDKSPDIHFKTEKNRDGEPMAFSAVITFDPVFWKVGFSPSSNQPQAAPMGKGQRFVLSYLSRTGQTAVKDIMSHADICTPNTARQAVYNLADSGYLMRVNSGKQGEDAIYDLTDKGKITAATL
ncbi:MAG TPA: AAA family ATPase [Anaerolineales bacterium]|nr:AAA family ATPase [Anaerolineales bacterium]